MKALTVGGAMIDTIAIIASDRIERMTMHNADSSFLLLEEGRKTEALEISTHVGGGAVNAAVAMARLGLDVAALVKLGKDAAPRRCSASCCRRACRRAGPCATGARRPAPRCCVSSHDRNAAIFTFRGANTLLEEADLRDEAFAADVVYVSSLSNESADAFPAIVRRAKAQGALVATNPRVRQLSSRGGAFQEALAPYRHPGHQSLGGRRAGAGAGGALRRGRPALPLEPGETPPRLAARGLVGGGHEMSLAAFLTRCASWARAMSS